MLTAVDGYFVPTSAPNPIDKEYQTGIVPALGELAVWTRRPAHISKQDRYQQRGLHSVLWDTEGKHISWKIKVDYWEEVTMKLSLEYAWPVVH